MPFSSIPPPDPGFNPWSVIIASVLSLWGGTVSFLHRVRRGKLKCNLRDYLVEICTSLFAGAIVYAFALSFGVDPLLSGALSGLGGHAGARTIFSLARYFL